MNKPSWLKKAFPNLPWRYKYTTEIGLIIEPYNFNTPIGFDVGKIDDAMQWIDEQMNKEEKQCLSK